MQMYPSQPSPPSLFLRKYPLLSRILLLGFGSLLATCQLHAQLSAEQLAMTAQLTPLREISISPDSTLVAYVLVRAVRRQAPIGASADSAGRFIFDQKKELWIGDLKSGRSFRICCDDAPQALQPSWSPDGQLLAFYESRTWPSDESGLNGGFAQAGRVAIWDRYHNSIKKVSLTGRLAPTSYFIPPLWFKDSRKVFVLVRKTTDDAPATSAQSAGDSSVHVRSTIGVQTLARSGQDEADELVKQYKDFTACDLMVVDVGTGASRTVLTDLHPVRVAASPDHRKLALANFTGAATDTYLYTQEIVMVDLESFQQRILLQRDTMSGAPGAVFTWSPDGRFLTFPDERGAPTEGGVANKFSDLIVIRLTDGSIRRLPADVPEAVYYQTAPIWSSDGELISFIRGNRLETWSISSLKPISKLQVQGRVLLGLVATESRAMPSTPEKERSLTVAARDPKTKKEGFWRVGLGSGRTTQLYEEDTSLGPVEYALSPELTPDGSKIVFRSESVDRAPELYHANPDLGDVRRMTDFGSSLDPRTMGRSRIISWKDKGGREITGSLLLPAQYERGHKYPVIVSLYPTNNRADLVNDFGMEQYTELWNNWQLYASRGYVVFEPNIETPSDSTALMSSITTSVLPGIEKLIELGVGDPEKVGCIGISGGGYAAIALLTQSKAFRAGVALDAPLDLLDLYSYGEGQRVVRVLLGSNVSIWKDRELLIKNSPYFFLDRISAPILVFQGSDDGVVPPHQSQKLFSGLVDLGKDAVYVEYTGEGHGFHVIEHQLDVFNRVLQWFDQRLTESSEAVPRNSQLSPKIQE